MIVRDKDANHNWSSASDGTLEERIYYCHNWRGDVSVLITDTGKMVEWVKYSSYGVPFGLPMGDTDSDGDVDFDNDVANINSWGGESGHPTGDTDLDGTITAFDLAAVLANVGTTLGWGVLSDVGNRKGYAGYELDDAIAGAYPEDSYSVRIFINAPDAKHDTSIKNNPSYAGRFNTFGHGMCIGGHGHCDPAKRHLHKYDLRDPHHYEPYPVDVDVTEALRHVTEKAKSEDAEVQISLVAVDGKGAAMPDSALCFDSLSLVIED